MRTGLNLRTSFTTTLYTLLPHLPSTHTSSTGTILSLLSSDIQRFEDAAPFAHFVWVGPLHILIVIYFMYAQVGWSCFASVGVLVALVPLQAGFAGLFGKLRGTSSRWRDERIKSLSDMLGGVLVVKLYAWERPFVAAVKKFRDQELHEIRKAAILRAVNEGIYFASSALIMLPTILVFHYTQSFSADPIPLTPSRIFTLLTYISAVRLSMANFFPKALQFVSESWVSLQRIEAFMRDGAGVGDRDLAGEAEILKAARTESGEEPAVVVKEASFSWGVIDTAPDGVENIKIPTPPDNINKKTPTPITSLKPTLQSITLTLPPRTLTCIIGPIGSGKSTLLSSLLHETTLLSGTLATTPHRIAYASQTPWILSGTIRENVVFGSAWDESWFWEVIKGCEMERDVEGFEGGVECVVGERGVMLSGGQRARVALARAVYATRTSAATSTTPFDGRANLVLLDDPLSAVDTRVGRRLFQNCIQTLLKDCTVVLVTHQLQYVRECDRVVLLEGGKCVTQGKYEDVMKVEGSEFADTMKEFWGRVEVDNQVDDGGHGEIGTPDIIHEDKTSSGSDSEGTKVDTDQTTHPKTTQSLSPSTAPQTELTKETITTGTIPLSTYYTYFRSSTSPLILFSLLLSLLTGEAFRVCTDWWLSHWSNLPLQQQVQRINPMVYIGLAVTTVVLGMLRGVGFFEVCWRSGRKLFEEMCWRVFRSPMSFFQTNPHGRVMNRFSKDTSQIDELLPQTFYDFTQCFFMIIGTLIISVVIIPYVLILIPVIFVLFVYLRKYYLATSRQIKRLESVTRSPVYSNIPSTLEGLSTIRSFRAAPRFITNFISLQNNNTRIFFMFLSSARWLGFRLDIMAAAFLAVIAFFAVGMKGGGGGKIGLTGGSVGLLLSYVMQLIGLLQWAVRQSAEVENLMISVERVLEYTRLEEEAPLITETRPPPCWPSTGEIKLTNLSLTYPRSAKSVLKNLTLTIPPGTRVGIVGRTGAGKSSFLQALFRIVEPTPAGSMTIDNLQTSSLGLEDLRSRLSIIPQDPFCFHGTLRFNIDPFSAHADEQIWSVLAAVELKDRVSQLPAKLDAPVSENGSNWSVGERQLICLARAILKKTKIVVMDEATSSVDLRTDGIIQNAVREGGEGGLFGGATVLTIAHRLNTVIDYDTILVLDDGRIVEVGSPWSLLEKDPEDPGAWFRRMVGEMGAEAQELLRGLAWDAEVRRREGMGKDKKV
ncbi:Multidrug resistance-associated protein 4 [Rhizophlyctis rosea]|nr:Multidrug resistance-associated protein 4 [Rhizophlyctis rosea]